MWLCSQTAKYCCCVPSFKARYQVRWSQRVQVRPQANENTCAWNPSLSVGFRGDLDLKQTMTVIVGGPADDEFVPQRNENNQCRMEH